LKESKLSQSQELFVLQKELRNLENEKTDINNFIVQRTNNLN